MKVEAFKTSELTGEDWQQITDGFSRTFDREKTKNQFLNYYTKNEIGYSFHATARDEMNKIFGYTSVVPFLYVIEDETVKMGLSGGSFVLEEYRSDIFIFKKMYDKLKQLCSSENLVGIIGVPNSNSFQYTIKILKKKHLRDLNYYVLPVAPLFSLSNNRVVKKGLNFLAKAFSEANHLLSRVANFTEQDKSVKVKESDTFLNWRLDERYIKFSSENVKGAYRMYNEDGRSVAYIMYFQERGKRTFRSLARLVKEILRNNDPDLIFYIGTLNLTQSLLFKVPKRFESKKLPLTITELEGCPDEFKEKLLSAKNWDFSLINFDVR